MPMPEPVPALPPALIFTCGPIRVTPLGSSLSQLPPALSGEFHAGVDAPLSAGVVVDFVAGLDELALADFHVLAGADGEVVVGAYLGLAVAVGGAVFLGLELAVAVGLDAVVALVADADGLVVLDVLVPVALGVQVDLLLALAVFDAQFVVAATAGGAEGLEQAAGLVGRQVVGDRRVSLWYRQPVTSGWSGSPSRKLTSTSMPTRGMAMPP